jgi:hypothetical protein
MRDAPVIRAHELVDDRYADTFADAFAVAPLLPLARTRGVV